MEKSEKRNCHHCEKRLKQGHSATMVKDGKKYYLHKSCAKKLEIEALKEQQSDQSNVVNIKATVPTISKTKPLVLQSDARVLREGLAKVFKMVPPPIQQEINSILSLYARNVAVYCQHPEKSFVPMRGCNVCIDCGAGDMA